MPNAILKAHYDGNQIVLDEPFELLADTPLMVTVLASSDADSGWTAIGAQNLARAFGDDKPEYTAADVKGQ